MYQKKHNIINEFKPIVHIICKGKDRNGLQFENESESKKKQGEIERERERERVNSGKETFSHHLNAVYSVKFNQQYQP